MILVGLLGVLAAVLLIVSILQLARSPGGKVNLGSQEFEVGPSKPLAVAIKKNGPLLFQALRGSQLDIFVQHLGTDPAHMWYAFEAHAPDQPRRCVLTWQPNSSDFADPCAGTRYPADGNGLNQYAVRVDSKGKVIVNLRQTVGTSPPTQ